MSNELYLIAHKVRGQPAFDIAIKVQIGDEEGWVIPTSGHRAYPFWYVQIHFYNDSASEDNWGASFYIEQGPNLPSAHWNLLDMPLDWPDHYPTPSETKQTGADLLKELGLTVRDWPTRFVRRI